LAAAAAAAACAACTACGEGVGCDCGALFDCCGALPPFARITAACAALLAASSAALLAASIPTFSCIFFAPISSIILFVTIVHYYTHFPTNSHNISIYYLTKYITPLYILPPIKLNFV
jgi:hypothetical protein